MKNNKGNTEELVSYDFYVPTREEIQKEYKVFELAKKYYMDPEELTDAIWEGIHSDRFSPFSNTKTYEKEEWERMMTEKYGEEWITW